MMTFSRPLSVFFVLSLILLIGTACTGGSEETPTVTPPIVAEITEAPAATALPADTATPADSPATETPAATVTESGPDAQPDLIVDWVEISLVGATCISPDQALSWVTNVSISNIGTAAAGPFQLAVDNAAQGVAGLAAGEGTVVTFENQSGNPEVIVDPAGEVSESDEANNRFDQVIPQPTPLPDCTPIPTIETEPVASISTEFVLNGLSRPVFLTHAFDDRLFVVQQPGQIVIIENGAIANFPFLDISDRVNDQGNEQGLLGLAFHPDYQTNGRFFVNYTDFSGATVISEFQVTADPAVADPTSERQILTVAQPYRNHNGGGVVFGPEGYLYIGMGDGGSQNDPENHAQNLQSLLGKILRIDIDQGEPYGIPADNPFVGNDAARNEIWSLGWRNPWRFSFDPLNGDMFIGDVGQNVWEEISYQPAGVGGLNYGWRIFEGSSCYLDDCSTPDLIPPIGEYNHSGGNCSITGGFIYRGAQQPALYGNYIFSDFCSGQLWRLYQHTNGTWNQAIVGRIDTQVSSFGVDRAGEIYVMGLGGDLYRVVQ